MAEPGSRKPANIGTALENIDRITPQESGNLSDDQLRAITSKLRQELYQKGLKGFKKGGKVKKTGPAKLHKGEFVVKAPAAKKAGPSKLKALNQSQRDIAMLKRKRMV